MGGGKLDILWDEVSFNQIKIWLILQEAQLTSLSDKESTLINDKMFDKILNLEGDVQWSQPRFV